MIFKAGEPDPLFETPDFNYTITNYAVTPDGQRFLVVRPVENASDRPLTVALN